MPLLLRVSAEHQCRAADAVPPSGPMTSAPKRVQKFRLREEGIAAATHDREALGIVIPKD